MSHGSAEFVAQEEMGRQDGYWWSWDSQSIAYQETDVSAVEVRYIADPLHPENPPQKTAYPHAGSANAKVRLGVISRDGGPTHWIGWDNEKFPYLARVAWSEPEAPLTFLVIDRRQQDERLLCVDPQSFKAREVLKESDPAWLDLVEVEMPFWLKGAKEFLWTSQASGFWQLELRDLDGTLIRKLTPPTLGYRSFVGIDQAGGSVFVVASQDPTESQLWKFPLAGGAGKALTFAKGGEHSAASSKDGRTFVHTYSLLGGTFGADVISGDGQKRATLASVAERPASTPQVELTRTKGERSYYAAVLKPRNFHPGKKYPVILSVYAGPQTTVVTSAAQAYFIDQWMADQGYIVARLDGRGTPRRGHDWQRVRDVTETLSILLCTTKSEAFQALGEQYPEMDLTRSGGQRMVIRRLF